MSNATIRNRAATLAAAFVGGTRLNGEHFRHLADTAPDWCADVVREAHGIDMMPDDWRYATIESLAGRVAECDGDPRDMDLSEEVDIYTNALTSWLASSVARLGYCDEAATEGAVSDDASMFDRLQAGQFAEITEIAARLIDALDSADEPEDDSGDPIEIGWSPALAEGWLLGRMMRSERFSLLAAVKSRDPARIRAAVSEAKRVAGLWSVDL